MSRTSELLCVETRALLARLLDGELAGAERERVERHLDTCPACASELRSAEKAFAALRDLPAHETARLRDEALRELGLADAGVLPSRRSRVIRLVLTLIAVAFLLVYLRTRREQQPLEV